MQFEMITDLSTVVPKSIEFNFDTLKNELEERLNYYNNLVITEDGIKDGKADLAKLRKLREAIDTRRKEVKKEYLRPYNDFESQCKDLLVLIDQPIDAVNRQLATYEEIRKQEKRAKIEEAYAAIVTDELAEFIPLERIFDSRWLNATMDMKKVEESMTSTAQRIHAELMVVETVEPEYAAAVKLKYKETLDFDAALKYREALRAASAASTPRQWQTPTEEATQPTATACEAVATEQRQEDTVYLLRLELQLSKAQATALKNFLVRNKIDHKKI